MTVTCGYASDNGEAPNLKDNHDVWNNANTDPNFGVSSPIVLWNLSTDGDFLGALHVPGNEIVTSFSSKSELALNRSADGRSLTFMGYRGGPGCPTLTLDTATNILTQGTNVGPTSPTAPNLLDVSASSTPGLCDPTNPAVASYAGANNPTAYYRSVAEVNAWGHISYTSVPNYPASIEPATGGCRNIIGVVNHDGTVTIYAITSTISLNGDNGADPNKLVKVSDLISATQPETKGYLDRFVTIRSARAGEAFRGVALVLLCYKLDSTPTES